MIISHEDRLRQVVWETVHRIPAFDMHTHIYEPRFRDRLLWGVDELLVYHYLQAETFRANPLDIKSPYGRAEYERFFALSKREQAELAWRKLFLELSPISETARGLLTTLGLLGFDISTRDISAWREALANRPLNDHLSQVLAIANVEAVVMTNDPFDDVERAVWEQGGERDPRFYTSLRLDGLLNEWKTAARRLKGWGYSVKSGLDKKSAEEVVRFLHDWCERIQPLYLAVSLPPDVDLFDDSARARLLAKCVLPVCRQRRLPLALMIGVKRRVNPELRLAGDAVGRADIGQIERLCAENASVRFLATMLSRENQHELCVASRKFSNLMPFGCWWFLNIPFAIEEITRMRLELLGFSFVAQHSDARVLEQLLYKWAHSRWILGHILQQKYCDLHRTGWRLTEAEIERDVRAILADNFKRFVGLTS
mgnify:CR=1 FL=1